MFKIITVDDEKMIKRSLRVMLENAGPHYRIVGEASNGREALEMIHMERPHLIITDICMPVMDGLELIAEVKQHYSQMKIIVISGYNEFNYAQQAIRHNVLDYLLKPINPEEFQQVLLRIYEQYVNDQRRQTDRREQMWKFAGSGEEIVHLIWTLQENNLNAKLDVIRSEMSRQGVGLELAMELYRDQLVYVQRKLEERNAGWNHRAIADEVGPANALDELHDQFRTACLSLFQSIVQQRNCGQSHQIKKTIAYLEDNFSNSALSLVDVAEYAAMSPAYFSRCFKDETGTNFMKHLTRLRIGKAKELLSHPEHKVGDVAMGVGYTNYHHFAKAFKKFTGITPTDYRKFQSYMES